MTVVCAQLSELLNMRVEMTYRDCVAAIAEKAPQKHYILDASQLLRFWYILIWLDVKHAVSTHSSPRASVTGESPPSLSKELTNSLAGVGDVSFDADSQFPLDELKIDPLTLDGLHMLNDPDMVLTDPATEDTFRMDRL